jgi:dipeptidyl aminopeptidase/acylaminoacyl peptidase
MTLRRGEHPDELISAAVSGDLTDDEQARLDAHLATCDACRQTMAAWTEQRRLVAGLRGAPVPRDLAPRIRTGIESGAFAVPWWRRTGLLVGVGATVATAAAAVVAVAVIGNLLPNPPVASTGSPSVVPSQAGSPDATASQPTASVEPSLSPQPTMPAVADESPYALAWTGKPQSATLGVKANEDAELDFQSPGPPIGAALSPTGTHLAFRVERGQSGMTETYVTTPGQWRATSLGTSVDGVFGQDISWSPDGRFLAYTLTSQDIRSDVWIFDAASGIAQQLTNTGDAFAASWVPDSGGGDRLWISRAAETPVSFLVELPTGGPLPSASDPADLAQDTAQGVFLPLVAPDGTKMIFWRGTMSTGPDGLWSFARGGMPYLGRADQPGRGERPLFSTLTPVGGEAFSSARIAWAPDSDGFAVWAAAWTGVGQPEGFPDRGAIYFGHVSKSELITPDQALDAPDLSGALRVVDVTPAPESDVLAITVVTDPGSEGGTSLPTSELRLVHRAFGSDPDQVDTLDVGAGGWLGPGFYWPPLR